MDNELKTLQDKNVHFKQMSVYLSLDHHILKNIIEKSFKLGEQKELTERIISETEVTVSIGLVRSSA